MGIASEIRSSLPLCGRCINCKLLIWNDKAELKSTQNFSVHDKFHRTLILSGFCLLKIAKISLNSSFFPKPIKR
ncbi:hypothetical protein EA736_15770 [Acinetobacter baumannii]|nr:hypothetical protein EA736_15770 [Acinetobacter baumannii]